MKPFLSLFMLFNFFAPLSFFAATGEEDEDPDEEPVSSGGYQ